MILLSNVKKLYDGTGSSKKALHEHVDVFIEKGKIASVKPHDPKFKSNESVSTVDCSSYTVTPGLFDCHSHLTIFGLSPLDIDRMHGVEAPFYIEKILHTSLVDGGVTTMRDIGGATHVVKRLVDQGVLIGPRLKIAICMLSTTGGHADHRSPDRCHADISPIMREGPGRPSSVVDGPDECRKRVREIVACGADVIKLCTSPGIASPGDKLENRDFTPAEIEAICDEAKGRGLRVAAHAHSKDGIRLAIENGVHDIQHISFMDKALAEKAHKKGCTVTPTSWIMYELRKIKEWSPLILEKIKVATEAHTTAVEYAKRGGLKILAGTDNVLHGMHGRNFMELTCLIQDGLSPLEAWYAATGAAAGEIGQGDTGEIKTGKRADLLICKEGVFDKPELLGSGHLLEVIKDGLGHRGLKGIPQRTFVQTVQETLAKAAPP